jgi:signal transduction histidine kinase
MLETLPSPESVARGKPLVAVIGDSEYVLGAIESCKKRVEFVPLKAIPERPNFWSVRQISGVVICGLDWFTRFCETKPPDELAVVVVVNNVNEFSAGLRAEVSSLLIEPFSGDLLLSQIERQLQFVRERKRSEQILGGQKQILEMIASGATFENTVEALTHLIERIEPDVRCAISAINSDGATFEDFLAMLHPKDRDRAIKAIEASIRDGVAYDIEYRVRHPRGETHWIAATGRTFKDDFDRPIRMSGVAPDVTERRRFDDALQENQYQLRTALNAAELARREAETATKAKDQFLAVLSHDLRTPLTPIMMAASWFRNSPEISEQARKAFEMIFRNVEQVLWNLLKNATKFTPEGGVVSVTSRNENNDIVVQVSDTGIGIDARVIPKIFVPFEQGSKDISKQFGGLGLGLAISKTIIDAHGGAIAVSSEGKDLGAVFSIRLPLTDELRLTGSAC